MSEVNQSTNVHRQLVKTDAVYEKGVRKLTIVEKIRDVTTGKMKKVATFIDDPDFHFYVTKPEHLLDFDSNYIEKDKVNRVNCKYKYLYPTIAKVTNKVKEYEAAKSAGKKLNRLHFDYNLHLSDMDLEDYTIRYWTEKNQASIQPLPLSKAFVDIEVNLEGYEGFPNEDEAPCPINFISYANDELKSLKIYVLYDETNESMLDFIDRVGSTEDGIISSDLGNEWALAALNEKFQDEKRPECCLKKFEVQFYATEVELIMAYYKDIHKDKPDFIGAWNGHFDFKTFMMRLYNNEIEPAEVMCPASFPYKQVNIRKDEFSVDISDKGHTFDIAGWSHYVDLLYYYAAIRKAKGKKESWKLDDILLEEIGENKFEYEGNIRDAVKINFEAFLLYSGFDSYRMMQMEAKNKDIDLMYGMSLISFTRLSKVMRKTTSLRNLGAKILWDDGYVVSNNLNKFYDHETKKFKGALTNKRTINSFNCWEAA